MKKLQGVSVQSIIIGSVVTGVIATAGLAALWPSVEAAKLTAERVTINEVSNAVMGAMEARMSTITYMDDQNEVKTEMDKRVNALPSYFTYHLAAENDADGNASLYLYAAADSNVNSEVQRLKDIVDGLDYQYDGAVDGTAGKFRFDTTCDGTAGCYYAVQLADFGIDQTTWGTNADNAIPASMGADNTAASPDAVQTTHISLN